MLARSQSEVMIMESEVHGVERKRRMLIKPVTPLAKWLLAAEIDVKTLASRCDVDSTTIYVAARGKRVSFKSATNIARETGINAKDMMADWHEPNAPAPTEPPQPAPLVQSELPMEPTKAKVVGMRRTITKHELVVKPEELLSLVRAGMGDIAPDADVSFGHDGRLFVRWEECVESGVSLA
jgi:hypothetical protein